MQQNFDINHKKMVLYFFVLWYTDDINTDFTHKVRLSSIIRTDLFIQKGGNEDA